MAPDMRTRLRPVRSGVVRPTATVVGRIQQLSRLAQTELLKSTEQHNLTEGGGYLIPIEFI